MRNRYETITPWVTIDTEDVISWNGFSGDQTTVTVVLEAADIRDTKNGDEYSYGCYRVRSFYSDTGKSFQRTRRFYGETARNSAVGLVDDISFKAFHEKRSS
jgi:hypothetical protein